MTTARLGTQGWTSSPKLPKWGSPRDLPCRNCNRNCNRNQSYHQDNTNKPRNTINGQTQPKRKKGWRKTQISRLAQTKLTSQSFPHHSAPGCTSFPSLAGRAACRGRLQGAFCSGHQEREGRRGSWHRADGEPGPSRRQLSAGQNLPPGGSKFLWKKRK